MKEAGARCGFRAKDNATIGQTILRHVFHFVEMFVDKLWKIYCQIGGGILLLLEAPVKSKFDGLTPP